ncbi:hypothetical protein [Nocardia cyriacigeorgica]|uniref:hypothetical protein n=1 Tax=Nocardia cyriacigeorgica TaxID=135487 RepID=UPI0024560386|nr:hypothetical protein [Nocardia cyriacigeorgica]
MDRAWSADDTITVRQVYGDLLRDREIAYTTVMTTVHRVVRDRGAGHSPPAPPAALAAGRVYSLLRRAAPAPPFFGGAG